MSPRIDNFTKQLHDNLEAVEDRAKSFLEAIAARLDAEAAAGTKEN